MTRCDQREAKKDIRKTPLSDSSHFKELRQGSPF